MVIPKKIPSKLDSCLSDVEFDGLEGLSINGQINPPVEGATVLLTSGGNAIDSMTTKSDGGYKFGPMDPHKEYDISIEHNDYRFIKSSDDSGNNFDAFELANVAIRVVGEDGKEMADVVVKLSGPKSGMEFTSRL